MSQMFFSLISDMIFPLLCSVTLISSPPRFPSLFSSPRFPPLLSPFVLPSPPFPPPLIPSPPSLPLLLLLLLLSHVKPMSPFTYVRSPFILYLLSPIPNVTKGKGRKRVLNWLTFEKLFPNRYKKGFHLKGTPIVSWFYLFPSSFSLL